MQTTKTRRPATRPDFGDPAALGPAGVAADWWNHEARPLAPAWDWPLQPPAADEPPADFLEPLTVGAPADPGRPADNDDAAEALTPASGRSAEQVPAEHAPAVQQPTPATLPAAEQLAAVSATAEDDRPAEWRPMTTGQKVAGSILAPLALGLGAGGFTISFATIQARMTPHFGQLAWLVPSSIDLGIIVFAGVHIWLAAVGMRMGWLRIVPWGLTAITIVLNATAYAANEAVLAHTTLPALWVIVCEVAAHVIGVRAGMKRGDRPDPIPLARWFLAPIATLRLWRNMRLWGIRSYKLAVAKERERMLVQTRLAEAFPTTRWWQSWDAQVPPMLLIRHKLRELTLADVEAELTVRAAEDITATAVRPTPAEPTTPTPDPGPAAETPAARPNVPAENRPAAPARPKTATRPTGQTPAADLAATFDRLAADLKRRPTGRELKDAAGCGLTKAKDWMKANRPITKGATA